MMKKPNIWLYSAVAVAFCGYVGPSQSLVHRSLAGPERLSSRGGPAVRSMSGNSVSDWQVKKEGGVMSAEVGADASTPDGTARSTLAFQCAPGKGGTATVRFTVLAAVKIKSFDFDDFEGPDAPATGRQLVTFIVQRAAGDLVVKTSVSGYYTVSDEGFAFENSAMANARSKVTQLGDALMNGASAISVRVKGLKNAQKTIEATFPAAGAGAILGQVMQACGGRR
jgi:hypothetical protein